MFVKVIFFVALLQSDNQWLRHAILQLFLDINDAEIRVHLKKMENFDNRQSSNISFLADILHNNDPCCSSKNVFDFSKLEQMDCDDDISCDTIINDNLVSTSAVLQSRFFKFIFI